MSFCGELIQEKRHNVGLFFRPCPTHGNTAQMKSADLYQ